MRCSKLTVIVLSILTILCATTTGWAGDIESVRPHSLSAGAWAVQFSIETYFGLRNFEGQFSIKKHITDKSAFRLGVAYSQSTEYTDNEEYILNDEYERYNLRISTVYILYPRKIQNINLYLGIGPEYGYDREGRVRGEYQDAYFIKHHTIGGIAVFGFEWFAFKEISLIAEYYPRIYYKKISGYRDGEYEGHGWDVNVSRAAFGLSVYF